jgi:hypothetical protein
MFERCEPFIAAQPIGGYLPNPSVNPKLNNIYASAFIQRAWSERLYIQNGPDRCDHRPKLHALANTNEVNFDYLLYLSTAFSHVHDFRFIHAVVDGVLQECIQVNTRPLNRGGFWVWTTPQPIRAFFRDLRVRHYIAEIGMSFDNMQRGINEVRQVAHESDLVLLPTVMPS